MKKKTPRLIIDAARYEVSVGGKAVHLSPKEFDVLHALHATKIVLSREDLMRSVWGKDHASIETRTVDQHIARLRRKIGRDFIVTVTSRGYKFAGN